MKWDCFTLERVISFQFNKTQSGSDGRERRGMEMSIWLFAGL